MDFVSNVPIYIQVINDIKHEIALGILQPGMKLLSARDMAIKYSINPNTANRIYQELETEGICYTKRGVGTFITEEEEKLKNIRKEMADELLLDFIRGMKKLKFSKQELLDIVNQRFEECEDEKLC